MMASISNSNLEELEVGISISERLSAAVEVAINNSLEQQVVVHCRIIFHEDPTLMRIWPSTVLLPEIGMPASKLLHAINISLYPVWTYLTSEQSPHHFTLIFEGLPKECEVFDLIESIPQPGGFRLTGIQRNEQDVYYVDL